MFANLESFSIFFFMSLAIIILAIAFEDKLVALEKKHLRKKAKRRNAARSVKNTDNKSRSFQEASVRSRSVPERKSRGFAA